MKLIPLINVREWCHELNVVRSGIVDGVIVGRASHRGSRFHLRATIENRLRDAISKDCGLALVLSKRDMVELNYIRSFIGKTVAPPNMNCKNDSPVVFTVNKRTRMANCDGEDAMWNDFRVGDIVAVEASLLGVRINTKSRTYDEEWTLHRVSECTPDPPERRWSMVEEPMVEEAMVEEAREPREPRMEPDTVAGRPSALRIPVLERSEENHYDDFTRFEPVSPKPEPITKHTHDHSFRQTSSFEPFEPSLPPFEPSEPLPFEPEPLDLRADDKESEELLPRESQYTQSNLPPDFVGITIDSGRGDNRLPPTARSPSRTTKRTKQDNMSLVSGISGQFRVPAELNALLRSEQFKET